MAQRSRRPTAALARSSERQASGVSPSTEASIRRPGALSPFAPSWSRPRGPLRSAPQIEWRETSAASAASGDLSLRLRSPNLAHDGLVRGCVPPTSSTPTLPVAASRGLARGGPPCPSARHDTADVRSAVPGPGCRHGGTKRHGMKALPCCIMSCFVVPVPCHAWAAHLAMYRRSL